MNKFDYSIYYRHYHDESPEHREQAAKNMANKIRPHLKLPKEARILDVGCGFGFALDGLKQLGYENISGLELSPQQAEACRRAGHKVEVTDDSIAWLIKHKSSLDFVILFDVLEHIRVDLQIEFMRSLHEALVPGGQVLISVPNANSILANRWRYNDYTHFSSFTENSLAFVVRNAGFSECWIGEEKGIGRFPRRLWRRSTWPAARKWIVRWCWFQVLRTELYWENIDNVCLELDLIALVTKNA